MGGHDGLYSGELGGDSLMLGVHTSSEEQTNRIRLNTLSERSLSCPSSGMGI